MISKCIEIGADDYLPKPFNPTILRARVSSELSKRSLRSMENEYRERIEQEKKHSEALLRNILPPEIAMRLRKGETNIADHFEDATIIFTGVVGFTKITARMRAFEIVSCLNRLFSEFDRLADDVGVEKIRTIGDSERTNDRRRRGGHGLPMRGNSHPIICWYGSPVDGIRSIAFLAKGLACSSVCRLSFGSDIHSRMILRRASCSGFMSKSFVPNGRRGQHKDRAVMRKGHCREGECASS
jgi:DNA-binding TFAR19-related protein (PDSD5 family)